MDSELIKWLAQMPKNYSLSGSKTSFYNGEKQLKLFLKIKDNQLFLFSQLIATPQTHDTTTPQKHPSVIIPDTSRFYNLDEQMFVYGFSKVSRVKEIAQ